MIESSKYTSNFQTRSEYVSRINNVIDYIQSNLKSSFTLDELAAQANFSKYHFHRIFSSIIGESLIHFIQRIRVEKAASYLANNPSLSITEVLFECGFTSSAHFSRVFKERFNTTPTQWRNKNKLYSKNSQKESKAGKVFNISSYYVSDATFQQHWRIIMSEHKEAKIEVKELPEMTVAYVRHVGPYEADEKLFEALFNKLLKWAGPRQLINFPETKFLSVYHDDPEITDKTKLRTDICLTVPPGTKVKGEIGKSVIPKGKYAVARFELKNDEFGEAWQAVMGGWLPESGYQCDDRPTFELYHNNYNEHPEKKHIVDICVPVKPL